MFGAEKLLSELTTDVPRLFDAVLERVFIILGSLSMTSGTFIIDGAAIDC